MKKREHKSQLCGVCGHSVKQPNWKKHWQHQHQNREPFELIEGRNPEVPAFELNLGRFKPGNLTFKRSAQLFSEFDARSQYQYPNKSKRLDNEESIHELDHQQELQHQSDVFSNFDPNEDDFTKKHNNFQGVAAQNNQNSQQTGTAEKNIYTILGEIMICNQSPPKLDAKLVLTAPKLMNKELLNLMTLL